MVRHCARAALVRVAFLGGPDAPEDRLPLVACEGFLAGIVSSPDVIVPSRWLPIVYGGDVAFESMEEASRVVGLLVRFSNRIARRLNQTLDFEPSRRSRTSCGCGSMGSNATDCKRSCVI